MNKHTRLTANESIVLLALLATFATPSAHTADSVNLRNYSTEFDTTENPLSENDAWTHNGLAWTRVITDGGVAYGTQIGTPPPGGYDDSYAYLSGFSPDHSAEGILFESPTADLSCSKEVEILLRWSDTENIARGYEVLFSINNNRIEIVRWNGPLGDFSYLARGPVGQHYFKTGDICRAEVSGTKPATITAYVNDIKLLQATDRNNAWMDGQPGIGFFRRSCGTNRDVGFSAFRAADGDISIVNEARSSAGVTVR
jgi:hypothetical protein